jgi:hypothetical protein
MEDFGFVKIGNIRNVVHHGYYEIDSFVCDVDLEFSNGEFGIGVPYATNANAQIQPGKYVYDQILAGNFSGEILEATAPVPMPTDDEIIRELTGTSPEENTDMPVSL